MGLSTLLVLSFATLALGQRPFFAGLHPIGYPEVTTEALADRFGEIDGTTQRLPVEANGDRNLVDRLSKLPIDKQPFWLINWQALEAHRQNPQTYPQKPNPFVDPIQSNKGPNLANFNSGNTNFNSGTPNSGNPNVNSNTENVNSNSGNLNLNSENVNPNSENVNSNSGNVNSNSGNVNSNLGNIHSKPGNVNTNSGVATSNVNDSGFVSSNRFGVEEHPNNKYPIESAFTNSNSGSSNSSSSSFSKDKQKSPSKDNKVHHIYRY